MRQAGEALLKGRRADRGILTRAFVAAVVLLAALIGLDESTLGVHRPSLGSLAFVRDGDVWIASGSGARAHKVIEDVSHPAWSPDGTKLAFVRQGEIWVYDFVTNRRRGLTYTGKRASNPGWLDRSTVAYSLRLDFELLPGEVSAQFFGREAERPSREVEVRAMWAVDIDSGRARELLGPISSGLVGDFHSPAVHPETKKLTFVFNGDVWIADSTREPIAARRAAACAELAIAGEDAGPVAGAGRASWTPGGVWVVFDVVDYREQETGELWAVNSFTGDQVQITQRTEHDLPPARYPSVSPTGGQIAYQEGNDIWLCGMDGSDSRRFLTNASQPAWSPRAAPLPRRPDGLLLPLGR